MTHSYHFGRVAGRGMPGEVVVSLHQHGLRRCPYAWAPGHGVNIAGKLGFGDSEGHAAFDDSGF